jgi:uncharacterized membrane protein
MITGHRPRLSLRRGPGERVAEVVGGVLMSAFVVFAVVMVPRMPASVPVHFGLDGRPDGWGSPGSLLVIPALAALFYAGLSVLQRYPEIYNYPTAVTPENAESLYRAGRQFVLGTKLFVVANFAVLFYGLISAAVGGPSILGAWYVPTVFGALICLLAVAVVRMLRAGRASRG